MSIITDSVQKLYERFPYPHYPLWAPLRWQDGYLTSSAFAQRLLADQLEWGQAPGCPPSHETGDTQMPDPIHMLLAGCGEALPYIVRKFEPASTALTCVDISERSIRRARWRLALNLRNKSLVAEDLDVFLSGAIRKDAFDHIDSFGVLHHLANPQNTIQLLAQSLRPGGTARFMVYNSAARTWITHLQKAFRLLKLDPHQSEDRALTRRLLAALAAASPAMAQKLASMGPMTINNETRLVDTFLHAHEIRWSLSRWLTEFANAGLQPYALHDRYAELDDLPNPLWRMPTVDELEARAADGRFEGNLEVFLHKPRTATRQGASSGTAWRHVPSTQLWAHYLKAPPAAWSRYQETSSLKPQTRYRLWREYLNWTYRHRVSAKTLINNDLAFDGWQRLARLGAILPGQITDQQIRKMLLQPMVDAIEPLTNAPHEALTLTDFGKSVRTIHAQKNNTTKSCSPAVLKRFEAAIASVKI